MWRRCPDAPDDRRCARADTNTPPRFTLPPGSCDAHFHVFEPGYPHVDTPLYTFPDGTVEQYVAMTEFLGIERMVLVQPTYYGEDNALTLDVLQRLGPRCGAVVRIAEDTTEAELDRYHEAGVRAIRLDLFARREQPTEEIVAYIRRMAARTTPRGWHLQFYTPGTVVRDLLPFLAELEDVFVIDHMGYMLESEGLTREDFEKLLEVLERGFCHIKLSGPYRIAKGKPLASVEWTRPRAGRDPARPAAVGLGLAAPARRPARHRRAAEPARRLGARRGCEKPDPRGHAAAAVLFVILSAVYSLKTFRIVALMEATSFLMLLVASVLKRTADADILVTILARSTGSCSSPTS